MQFSGLIGFYVRTGLNSAKHGRNILFDAYEVLPAEQDSRPAALAGLYHQYIVEVDQNLSCRRSRSFQCDENGQSGLLFLGWRRRRLPPDRTPTLPIVRGANQFLASRGPRKNATARQSGNGGRITGWLTDGPAGWHGC